MNNQVEAHIPGENEKKQIEQGKNNSTYREKDLHGLSLTTPMGKEDTDFHVLKWNEMKFIKERMRDNPKLLLGWLDLWVRNSWPLTDKKKNFWP